MEKLRREALLTRLVEISHQRAAEEKEKRGLVRYLRLKYQDPDANLSGRDARKRT